MDNLSGMVFLMLLPIFFGAMAVFLMLFLQYFIVRIKDLFFNDDNDFKELYK